MSEVLNICQKANALKMTTLKVVMLHTSDNPGPIILGVLFLYRKLKENVISLLNIHLEIQESFRSLVFLLMCRSDTDASQKPQACFYRDCSSKVHTKLYVVL
jgi:hypothetical protein